MTGRCDDNPDHYERSHRFRHLIPGWSLQRCETGRAPRHCSWAKPHTTASRSYEKGIDRAESRTRQSEARLVSKVWEDTRQPSSSGQTLASGETHPAAVVSHWLPSLAYRLDSMFQPK
ncbi:hypothetical protein TNCT_220981 [Trichonephila clavata]|uniref:Uncharacterized protein n=1 Tax=Trichonephila clavata TaxID=2740835 RepID=A0A8X6HBF6_TRICU|nr:hypothetical protein TNCT_220981 [Trichonephila clavata]